MKILVISTNVIALNPSGYSGLEYLTTKLAEGLKAKGHEVAIIGPEGSLMPEGIELITTKYREPEEASWQGYKSRLEEGWDAIVDASWEKWSYMSSAGRDPQLPIISWCHTAAELYSSLPAVQYPMFVGVSRDHAERIGAHLGVSCRYVYNGVDVGGFYKPDPEVKRGERYLWLSRYTPEKGPLEAIQLAKKLRFGLDMVGDLEIISDRGYAQRCLAEADGRLIRCVGSVPREETVKYYQKAKALILPLGWCIHPETKVFANPMPISIKEIKEGTLVMNRTGEYVPVRSISRRKYSGELITIAPSVLDFPIKVTPQHQILTASGTTASRPSLGIYRSGSFKRLKQWRLYEEMTKLKNQGIPKEEIKAQLKMPETTFYYWWNGLAKPQRPRWLPIWKRVADLQKNDFIAIPIPQPDQAPLKLHIEQFWDISITPELLFLAGLYIAEGSLRREGIEISLGPDEMELAEEAKRALEHCFNATVRVERREHAIRVYTWTKWLTRYFGEWFGSGAENKRIPPWIFNQPTECLWSFMRGIWLGDGCKSKRGQYEILIYSTKSQTLALQMCLLLLRLGIIPSLKCKRQGNNAYGAGNPIYIVGIGSDAGVFSQKTGLWPVKHWEKRWRSWGFFYDGLFWVPIRETKKENYEGEVIDLETDGSYTAGLTVVHNSEPFGLVIPEANSSGCPVVVLARGAMPELVEHGKSGFLCRNISEMEEVLRKDMVKDIKPEDCIAQAQKFSLSNFVDSWERLIEGVKAGERW